MPLINTLGALVSAKNVVGTVPTGLGFLSSTSDVDATNWAGLSGPTSISNTVVIDGSSNVFVPYRIFGTAGLGNNSQGTIAKLSSTGSTTIIPTNIRDSRTISGSRVPCFFLGISLDSSDNIYGAGLGSRIDGSNLYEQTLVRKYNSAGTLQWSNLYYIGTNNQYAIDIKVDSANNLYILSRFSGINPSTILTKIDSGGTVLWGRNFSGNPLGMTIDSSDNVVVLSFTTNSLVTKFNSSGTRQWSVTINTVLNSIVWNSNTIYLSTLSGIITLNDSGVITNQLSLNVTLTNTRISLDASGNIYFGGATNTEIYLTSLDSTFTPLWQNSIQVNPTITYPDEPYLTGIGIDGDSIVVAFNQYSDEIASGEIRSMYVVKVPSNGKILMRGRYVLSDNIIFYNRGSVPSVSTTSFSASAGVSVFTTTITREAITLTSANISDWYNTII
jgi:hypothetical protein